ncbi:putative ribonuclease H-like domain-containing protein [Tanacetum coccineum]
MIASSLIYLLSKASNTKSWLWHRRLSHLNFGAINHLARHGLRGLPKLKFEKDHLCSECAIGKRKKQSHKPKSEDTNQQKLYLLHMDLCGPMRIASVNGKKYIGIKSLLNVASITAGHIRVNYKVNAAEGVNAASEEVSTVELMIDYALWEVIKNGATLPKTQVVEGVTIVMPITSTEDKAQRRLEVKARSTLMMCIPNGHQLKFNSIKDAKLLLEALKSQLELLDEKLSQKDVNQKLLKSLSSEWNTHVVVWRNKTELETMSMDDLYNNLKVYEPEVKGMSSSSSNTQNIAFVSSSNNNTSSSDEVVNAAHGVNTAST